MREFEYTVAEDVAGAVALVAAREDARFLGGGTNLVDLMKLGVERPGLLVDVTALPLSTVARTADGGLRIGAMVRNSDLAAHPEVRRRYPVISRAVLAGASGQLRNVATVGGNLMQRTRCRYFVDVTKPCNRRAPGSGCPARHGEHRNLAILGGSAHCVATHPSDLLVALVALDTVVHLHEPGAGDRALPLTEFLRLPGDEPHRETTAAPGALVTAVELPPPPDAAATYRKVRERASFAFAVASVAAALRVRDGRVEEVRLALGAVAPVPWRARVAERALRGGPATTDAFLAAADAELGAAEPLRDNGFKVPLVRNLMAATLTGLLR